MGWMAIYYCIVFILYCCISARRNFQWENGNYLPNVRAIYRSSWYLSIGVAPSTVPLSSFPSLMRASSSKDRAWDLGIRQVWVPVQVLLFTDSLPWVRVCSFVKWTLWEPSYTVVCTTHWHHEPDTNHSKKEIHNKTKVHSWDPGRSTQTCAWAMQVPHGQLACQSGGICQVLSKSLLCSGPLAWYW